MDHHCKGGFQDRVLHVCRACYARATSHAACELHRQFSHHRSSGHVPHFPGINVFAPLRRPR